MLCYVLHVCYGWHVCYGGMAIWRTSRYCTYADDVLDPQLDEVQQSIPRK